MIARLLLVSALALTGGAGWIVHRAWPAYRRPTSDADVLVTLVSFITAALLLAVAVVLAVLTAVVAR